MRMGHIAAPCSRKLIEWVRSSLSGCLDVCMQGLQNAMADAFPDTEGISRSAAVHVAAPVGWSPTTRYERVVDRHER